MINSENINQLNPLFQVFANISDLVFIMTVDEEGLYRYIFVNEPGKRHLGSPVEVVGKSIEQVMPSGVASRIIEQYDNAVQNKMSITYEDTPDSASHSPSEIIFYESKITPFFDEHGSCTYIITIVRDVSDRKRTEIELRESEERYRKLVEMSPHAIIVHQNGIILYANASAQRSVKDANPIGKSVFDYIHPDYHEISKKRIHIGEIGEEIPFMEIKMNRTDGEMIYADIGGALIPYNGSTAIMTIFRDVTERKFIQQALQESEEKYRLLAEKMSYMAYHDTLTDLPNRRLFMDRLEQSIAEAEQYGKKIAVLYLDLDYFKTINDRFGHNVGDEFLILFSRRVNSCIRASDLFARLGGDEFSVLIEIDEEKDAIIVAQKIIQSLQQKWIMKQYDFEMTSSIGIAIYEHGLTAKALIKAADIALYQAKEKGRNTYQIYRTEHSSRP